MKKVVFYNIIGWGVVALFLTESCSFTNLHEECHIKRISSIHFYDDSAYSVRVLFNIKTTKEQRKVILSQKLIEDYPQLILYDEHPGKRYNEYWYTLKARDTSTIQLLCNCIADTVNYPKTPEDILSCLAGVGKDDTPVLNECESKILNYKYQSSRGTFDFYGKKVAFFSGSLGKFQISKKKYFENLIESFNHLGYIIQEETYTPLVFFSEVEAEQIGYDVIVFTSSKKKKYSKEDVIARLKQSESVLKKDEKKKLYH